jgi:hypothetical protein
MVERTALPFSADSIFSYIPSVWTTSYVDKRVMEKFYEALVRLSDAEYANILQLDDVKELSSTPVFTYYPVIEQEFDNWQSYQVPHSHYNETRSFPTISSDGLYRARFRDQFLLEQSQLFLDGIAIPTYFYRTSYDPWVVNGITNTGTTFVFDPVAVDLILSGNDPNHPAGNTHQQWSGLEEVERLSVFSFSFSQPLRAEADGATTDYALTGPIGDSLTVDPIDARLFIEAVPVLADLDIVEVPGGFNLTPKALAGFGQGSVLQVTLSDDSQFRFETTGERDLFFVPVTDTSLQIVDAALVILFEVGPNSVEFNDARDEMTVTNGRPFYGGALVRVRDAAGVQVFQIDKPTSKIKLNRPTSADTTEVLFLGVDILSARVAESAVFWGRPLNAGVIFRLVAPILDDHDHASYREVVTTSTNTFQVPIDRPFALSISLEEDPKFPIQVFIDGILQDPSTYIFSDTRTVEFNENQPTGAAIDFFYVDLETPEEHRHITQEVAVANNGIQQFTASLDEPAESDRFPFQIFDDGSVQNDPGALEITGSQFVQFEEALFPGTLVIIHAAIRSRRYNHTIDDRSEVDYGYLGKFKSANILQNALEFPTIQLILNEGFSVIESGDSVILESNTLLDTGWFFDCAVDEHFLANAWGAPIDLFRESSEAYRRTLSVLYAALRGPSFKDSILNHGSVLLGSDFVSVPSISRGVIVDPETGQEALKAEPIDGDDEVLVGLIPGADRRILDAPTVMPGFFAVNELLEVIEGDLSGIPWLAFMAQDVSDDYSYAKRLDVGRPKVLISQAAAYDPINGLLSDYSVSFHEEEVRAGDLVQVRIVSQTSNTPSAVLTRYTVVEAVVNDHTLRILLAFNQVITAYGELGYGEGGFGGALKDPTIQSYKLWTRKTRSIDDGLYLDEALDPAFALADGENVAQINQTLGPVFGNFAFGVRLDWDANPGKDALEDLKLFINTIKPSETYAFVYSEVFRTTPLSDTVSATIGLASTNLLANQTDFTTYDGDALVSTSTITGPFLGSVAYAITDDDTLSSLTLSSTVSQELVLAEGYSAVFVAKADSDAQASSFHIIEDNSVPAIQASAVIDWDTGTLTISSLGGPLFTATSSPLTDDFYRVTLNMDATGENDLRVEARPADSPTTGTIHLVSVALRITDKSDAQQDSIADSYYVDQTVFGSSLMKGDTRNDYLYHPEDYLFGVTVAGQTPDAPPSPSSGDHYLIASEGFISRSSATITPNLGGLNLFSDSQVNDLSTWLGTAQVLNNSGPDPFGGQTAARLTDADANNTLSRYLGESRLSIIPDTMYVMEAYLAPGSAVQSEVEIYESTFLPNRKVGAYVTWTSSPTIIPNVKGPVDSGDYFISISPAANGNYRIRAGLKATGRSELRGQIAPAIIPSTGDVFASYFSLRAQAGENVFKISEFERLKGSPMLSVSGSLFPEGLLKITAQTLAHGDALPTDFAAGSLVDITEGAHSDPTQFEDSAEYGWISRVVNSTNLYQVGIVDDNNTSVDLYFRWDSGRWGINNIDSSYSVTFPNPSDNWWAITNTFGNKASDSLFSQVFDEDTGLEDLLVKSNTQTSGVVNYVVSTNDALRIGDAFQFENGRSLKVEQASSKALALVNDGNSYLLSSISAVSPEVYQGEQSFPYGYVRVIFDKQGGSIPPAYGRGTRIVLTGESTDVVAFGLAGDFSWVPAFQARSVNAADLVIDLVTHVELRFHWDEEAFGPLVSGQYNTQPEDTFIVRGQTDQSQERFLYQTGNEFSFQTWGFIPAGADHSPASSPWIAGFDNGTSPGFHIGLIVDGTDQYRAYFRGSADNDFTLAEQSGSLLPVGTPFHLVATYFELGSHWRTALVINSQVEAISDPQSLGASKADTVIGTLAPSPYSFYIGGRNEIAATDDHYGFIGKMQQPAVWLSVALDTGTINTLYNNGSGIFGSPMGVDSTGAVLAPLGVDLIYHFSLEKESSTISDYSGRGFKAEKIGSPNSSWKTDGLIKDAFPRAGDVHPVASTGFYVSDGEVRVVDAVLDQASYSPDENPITFISGPGIPQPTPGVFNVGALIYTLPNVWLHYTGSRWSKLTANPVSVGSSISVDDQDIFRGFTSPGAPGPLGVAYAPLVSDIVIVTSPITIKMEAGNSGSISEITLDGTHIVNSQLKGRELQAKIVVIDDLGVRTLVETGHSDDTFASVSQAVFVSSSILTTQEGTEFNTVSYMGYDQPFLGLVASGTRLSKRIISGYRNDPRVARIDFDVDVESSTVSGGGVQWGLDTSLTDIFTRVYTFDPAVNTAPVESNMAVNSIGLLATDYAGGAITSNDDQSVAYGVFRYEKLNKDSVLMTNVIPVSAEGLGAKLSPNFTSFYDYELYPDGTSSGIHSFTKYIATGTLAEVSQAFRDLFVSEAGGILASTDPATKVVITSIPSTVDVTTTFTVVISAVGSGGTVDPIYSGTAMLALTFGTGALSGTTTVAFSSGTAVLTGLALSEAGIQTLQATSAGLASDSSAISVTNVVPQLDSILPTTVNTGVDDTVVRAFGASFVSTSSLRSDGTDRDTTFVSPGEVTGVLPASLFSTETTIGISVFNPVPGGGESFAIILPVVGASDPVADTLLFVNEEDSPKVSFTGTYATTVNAVDSTKGNAVDTSFTDSVTLSLQTGPGAITGVKTQSAVLGAAVFGIGFDTVGDYTLLTTSGVLATDTSVSIEVYYPDAILTSLSPTTVPLGSGDVDLSIFGSPFYLDGSTVSFNGAVRTTQFVSPKELIINLVTDDFTSEGMVQVIVTQSPALGTGISNPLVFSVGPDPSPAERIVVIVGTSTEAVLDTSFTINVSAQNDAGLVPDHAGIVTTALSTGTGTLSGLNVGPWIGGLQQFVGSIDQVGVKTFSISDDQGLSPASPEILIGYPVPTLNSLSPLVIDATSPAAAYGTVMSAFGTGFYAPTLVYIDGSPVSPTTYVSPGEVTIVVPSPVIDSPEFYNLTIFTPSPLGGTSTPQPFQIYVSPSPEVIAANKLTMVPSGVSYATVNQPFSFLVGAVDDRQLGGPVLDTTITGTITIITETVNSGSPHYAPSPPVAQGLSNGYTTYALTFSRPGDLVFRATHTGVASPLSPIVSSPATALTPGNLEVYYPTPILTSLSPDTILSGSSTTTLTVTGTSFFSTTNLRVQGLNRTTTYISATKVSTELTSSDLLTAKLLTIDATNGTAPPTVNRFSNALTVVVEDEDLPPPDQDSEEGLSPSIRVTRTSWQRLLPALQLPTISAVGFGLRDALRQTGLATNGSPIHPWNGLAGATEVIEVEAGLYSNLEFGTSSSSANIDPPTAPQDIQHPVVIRAKKNVGVAEPVVIDRQYQQGGATLQVNTNKVENRHWHWYDIFFRPSDSTMLNSFAIGTPPLLNDNSLNDWRFIRCTAVGEWDHRAIELVRGRWVIGAHDTANQTQWDDDAGDALPHKNWILDDVWKAWCGFVPDSTQYPEYSAYIRPHNIYSVAKQTPFKMGAYVTADSSTTIRDGMQGNSAYSSEIHINTGIGVTAAHLVSSGLPQSNAVTCEVSWIDGDYGGNPDSSSGYSFDVSSSQSPYFIGDVLTVPVVAGVAQIPDLEIINRGDYLFQFVYKDGNGVVINSPNTTTNQSGLDTALVKVTQNGMGSVATRLRIIGRTGDPWYVGRSTIGVVGGSTEYMPVMLQMEDQDEIIDVTHNGTVTATISVQPAHGGGGGTWFIEPGTDIAEMAQGVAYFDDLRLRVSSGNNSRTFFDDNPNGVTFQVRFTFVAVSGTFTKDLNATLVPMGFGTGKTPYDPQFDPTAAFPKNTRAEFDTQDVEVTNWPHAVPQYTTQNVHEIAPESGLGRKYYPGWPGDPAHPNYTVGLGPAYPDPADVPGLVYAGGLRNKWCIFTNEVRDCAWIGGTYGLVGLEHAFYIHNVVGDFELSGATILRTGRTGIQITNRRGENSAAIAIDENSSAGPNQGNVRIVNNTFADTGIVDATSAITISAHNDPVYILDNTYYGGFTKHFAHIKYFATGAVVVWDGPQFSNSGVGAADQMDHWYQKSLVDVTGAPIISEEDTNTWFTNDFNCPPNQHPNVPVDIRKLVCLYPYLPNTSPGAFFPPVFTDGNNTDQVLYNAGSPTYGGYHQNPKVVLDGNNFYSNQGSSPNPGSSPYSIPINNRNPYSCANPAGDGFAVNELVSLSGIRDLLVTNNTFAGSKTRASVTVDIEVNGRHRNTPCWLIDGYANTIIGEIRYFLDKPSTDLEDLFTRPDPGL